MAKLYGELTNLTITTENVTTSSSLVNTTTFEPESSYEYKILVGIALQALVCMTVGGNILVLLSVAINRKLRTTTNYLVVSLAAADLLIGSLVLPFSAILQLEKRWLFGSMFCDIWASTDVLCCTASILSLCAISIDRYIGVTHPLKHRNIMSSRRTLLIIFALWILSFAISLGPLIGWRDRQRPVNSCPITTKPGYVVFSMLGSFYIPALIIIGIYARIYKEAIIQAEFLKTGFKQTKTDGKSAAMTLRANTRRNLQSTASEASLAETTSSRLLFTKHSPSVGSNSPGMEKRKFYSQKSCPNGGMTPASSSLNIPSTTSLDGMMTKPSNKLKQLGRQLIIGNKIAKFNKEKKAAKTLGIVVGVFLVCWFPFFFILPLDTLCQSCKVPPLFFDIVFWLGYCNSMLNPIIYATWNREFKETFLCILRCQCVQKKEKLTIGYLARASAEQMSHISKSPGINSRRKNRLDNLNNNNNFSQSVNAIDEEAEPLTRPLRRPNRPSAFSDSVRSAPPGDENETRKPPSLVRQYALIRSPSDNVFSEK